MSSPRASLRRRTQPTRKLSLESLESRVLLSVSPLSLPAPGLGVLASHAALVGSPLPAAHPSALSPVGGQNGTQGGSIITPLLSTAFDIATPLTLSASGSVSTSGNINTAGSVVMYSLVADLSGTMTVAIPTSSKLGLIPQLTIYDDGGNVLASGSGTNKRKTVSCSFNVASGITYYIAVGGVSASTGSYTLNISTTVPAPPPPPPPPPTPISPPSWMPGANSYSAQSAVTAQVLSTSGGQVLVILGTAVADSILVSQSDTTVTVITTAGSQSVAGSFVGIAVYGFGGGDTIRLDHTVAAGLSAAVYESGTVANTISDAGMDASFLYAGNGNDTLVSVGGGSDVLYGGAGVDSFWSDSTDTLLGTNAAETAAQSIHTITAFSQPTATSNITLQIDGQTLPQPVAAGSYSSLFVNNPLFAGVPQFTEALQGASPDCYWIAGLSSLADNNPGLLQQSIVALGDGSYAVRFFGSAGPTYWRIDAQLATSGTSTVYAHVPSTGSLWAPLLEKAFAQFRSGQNSYDSISSGWMHEAYIAITGGTYSWSYTTATSADALAQSMANSLAASHAVTAASLGSEPSDSPIVGSHAYNVHAVNYVNGTWYVSLYNPWGSQLTVTSAQFQTWFSYTEVCSA
jgi:hypothetical protein